MPAQALHIHRSVPLRHCSVVLGHRTFAQAPFDHRSVRSLAWSLLNHSGPHSPRYVMYHSSPPQSLLVYQSGPARFPLHCLGHAWVGHCSGPACGHRSIISQLSPGSALFPLLHSGFTRLSPGLVAWVPLSPCSVGL